MEIVIDSMLDTLKILPYLLITFIILEFIEHKLGNKSGKILIKNRKYGVILGGILGGIPQCGFSVVASRLFSSKIITLGTLIAVYLATSDEMIPIMLSENANIETLISIIIFKVIIGIILGLLIDLVYRKKIKKENISINNICQEENCHCNSKGIIYSSVKHTLKIALFILIANLLIGFIINKLGEENLTNILLKNNLLTYFGSSLIGLIPNCASSVIITKLYISKLISIGTLLSGLLTGSGLGILILFKENKNLKENILILFSIYIIGVIIGIIVDLII